MGGHIDFYGDISSPYSYIAISYLQKQRKILSSYDVTVNLVPVFLGGINVGSGNKPPWTLPAKAAYGKFDLQRAKKYHNLEKIESPDFFPPLTILTQRALCYIKAHYPASVFEAVWVLIFQILWTPPQQNVTLPGPLAEALTNSTFFTPAQVSEIMHRAGEQEWKDKLTANTKEALDRGAFGAPWFWVRNETGKEEPFFGSDKWHFMWEFLGLPWQDIKILPKSGRAKL